MPQNEDLLTARTRGSLTPVTTCSLVLELWAAAGRGGSRHRADAVPSAAFSPQVSVAVLLDNFINYTIKVEEEDKRKKQAEQRSRAEVNRNTATLIHAGRVPGRRCIGGWLGGLEEGE
jgi:hypothetical protein